MSSIERDQTHLYALCWNEAKMLPYFFRHYNELVDKFFIYDNGSTDGSLELLAGDERVCVVRWEPRGNSFVEQARELSNDFWKPSRGRADWVITAEVDEHLYHPGFRAYLGSCVREGITAIKAIGYEMVADRFPSDERPLWQFVTHGIRAFALDKLSIFDPSAIRETNYEGGRHQAAPTGRVLWDKRREIRLLHYKNLGPAYVAERNAVLAKGIRPGDLGRNFGTHYFVSDEEVAARHQTLKSFAKPVPGLGAEADASSAPGLPDELCALFDSGLFQGYWYLTEYPDVTESGFDPLEHFCRHGWREMRNPNPHFHTEWYRRTYADAVGPDANPLLDYVLDGEKAGRRPSADFDPLAYRAKFGLAADESPLRHYLARRSAGLRTALWRLLHHFGIGVERRLPRHFDRRLYLEANPDVAAAGLDPAWHYVRLGMAEGRMLRPTARWGKALPQSARGRQEPKPPPRSR